MTTFTQLQCFNKLLLEKLEQTLKDKEGLMNVANDYTALADKYSSLIDLLENHGGLDDLFECRECGKWYDDHEVVIVDNDCDCGLVCQNCEECVWVCDECEASFCRCCYEEEGHRIHHDGLHAFCDECIVDVVKQEQKLQYETVMEELIVKHNPELYYKTLHKQNYRDVINSIPRKCWCGKNIVCPWDCDVCFYDGEKSDTDSDAF